MAEQHEGIVPGLSVEAAAARLGLSKWGTYKLIERGELTPAVRNPVRLNPMDVEVLRARRQAEATARLTARGVDLVQIAKDAHRLLHPEPEDPVRGGVDRLSSDVRAALGAPLLAAAALPEGGGCTWCGAMTAARMLRTPLEERQLCSPVALALLGGPQCDAHRQLVRGWMGQLRAHVHPGGGQKPPTASVKAATAPTAPIQAVSGPSAGWTPRMRARKTTAAAARPGMLRCGHALAAGCTCPRLASRRESR